MNEEPEQASAHCENPMPSDSDPHQKARESMLAGSLVVLTGSMILFFLFVISFGVIGNVIAGAVIMVMVGAVHYLVWGHALTAEVAPEREAMRRQDAREAIGPAVNAIQDLARTPAVPPAPLEPPSSKPSSHAIRDHSRSEGIQPS